MAERCTWLLLALLAGCAPKAVDIRDPSVALPAAYAAPELPGPSAAALDWSAFFGDPRLAVLIDDALAHNKELEIVSAEVQAALAEVGGRRSEVFPRMGLRAGAGVEKVGRNTSQGAADARSQIEPGKPVPENLGQLDVAAELSWEVDIWKKLRNATQAARERYLASVEGQHFLRTQLVAEVAATWYELLAADTKLEVVDANIALLERGLEVVRLQKQAARTNELAVQRFEAELFERQSRRYALQQEITEAEIRLGLLCGRAPAAVEREAREFELLTPVALPTGLPTALLQNRPDIRAAERELAATRLDVKVARAMFYPSLSIDAELGLEAYAARRLLATPESLLWGASASLLAPVLNRRGLKANLEIAYARELQAVAQYEQTVLQAYAEAATELSRVQNLERQYARNAAQVGRLQAAIETSTVLFRSARADYFEVLMTRRDALEAQLERIETREAQLAAVVHVYQALGGGWRSTESGPADESQDAG